MQNKLIVVMVACIGTMLYCSDFLLVRKESQKNISQEMLFKRVKIVLRRTMQLAQKVACLQSVLLDTTTSIVDGSLKQAVRKEFVYSMECLERVLSKCEQELNKCADFLDTKVVHPTSGRK